MASRQPSASAGESADNATSEIVSTTASEADNSSASTSDGVFTSFAATGEATSGRHRVSSPSVQSETTVRTDMAPTSQIMPADTSTDQLFVSSSGTSKQDLAERSSTRSPVPTTSPSIESRAARGGPITHSSMSKTNAQTLPRTLTGNFASTSGNQSSVHKVHDESKPLPWPTAASTTQLIAAPLLIHTKPNSRSDDAKFSSAAQATIISISSVLAALIIILVVYVLRRRRRLNNFAFYRVQVTAQAVTEPMLVTDHLLPDDRIVDYNDYVSDGSYKPAPMHRSSSSIIPGLPAKMRAQANLPHAKSCNQLPTVKAELMVELTAALQSRQRSRQRSVSVAV